MPAYKSIAIAGVGTLGSRILAELGKKEVNIKVISREDSQNKVDLPANAQLITVDYSSQGRLQAALEGVEVVISTLTSFVYDQQENLARAAKAVGVKLFIPSEFSNPTLGVKTGLLSGKARLHDLLDDIGISYTLIFTGPWPDLVISPMFGFNFPSKVIAPGDGRQPVTWTSIGSIASFLAGVLTSSSVPTLPHVIRLEGTRASFRDVAALFEKVKGVKVGVEETPVSELEKRIAANPKDGAPYVLKEYAEDRGGVGEPNGKEVWPGWEPEKLADILSRL